MILIRARMRLARVVRWCLAAALAGGGSIPAAAGAAGTAVVGRPAPRFVIETATGDEMASASLAGRPAVLNVFASWCPPCREELPRIVAAARRSGRQIRFVGVDAQESVQIATAFAKRMHIPYDIVFDRGQFAASYGAAALPETIFIDKNGIVRAIVHGVISQNELDRDLQRLGVARQAALR